MPRDRFNSEIRERCGNMLAETFDGRVLTELFEAPPQVRYVPPVAPDDSSGDGELDAAEEAQIRERLRALGYMT